MVMNAMSQCRRDLLWQRMLVTRHGEEEGRRKRRSERQTDQDLEQVSCPPSAGVSEM